MLQQAQALHVSLSVRLVHMCHLPFVEQACERIRQLQSRSPGRRATSWWITGQPVDSREDSFTPAWEKKAGYESEAAADNEGVDRRCGIAIRLMFHSFTRSCSPGRGESSSSCPERSGLSHNFLSRLIDIFRLRVQGCSFLNFD